MYRSDQFMQYAAEYLNQKVDRVAIAEIREVRQHEENRRHAIERDIIRHRRMLEHFEGERQVALAEIESLSEEERFLEERLRELSLRPSDADPSLKDTRERIHLRMHELQEKRRAMEGRAEMFAARASYEASRATRWIRGVVSGGGRSDLAGDSAKGNSGRCALGTRTLSARTGRHPRSKSRRRLGH